MRRLVVLSIIAAAVTLLAGPVDAQQAQERGDPLTAELRQWTDDHGPIRVGYFPAPPMVIVEGGAVTGGWMVELLELTALKLGVSIEPVVAGRTPAEAVAALLSGEVDVLGGAGSRPDLQGSAQPTTPYAWTPAVFVVGPGAEDATSLDDLRGRSVTTISGSPLATTLREDFRELDYVVTDDISAGIAKVVDGDIDSFYGPLAIIGYELQQTGATLKPVGDATGVTEVSAWGLRGGEAIEVIEAGRRMITDKELAVIHVRWTGFDLGEDDVEVPTWLLPTFALAAGTVALLLLTSLTLRRRVAAATRDLRELNESLDLQVRKRTAELAISNNALALSNGALEDLGRTAAHDLRGPLSGVRGAADLLSMQGGLDEGQTELVEMIGRSASGMAEMIESLLDKAAVSGGPEPIDGAEFDRWIHDVFDPELAAAQATLDLRLPDGTVDCDSAVLKHAAANLIGNAIKYAGNPQGTVIDVDVRGTDGGWLFSVADNGPGVPADLVDTIFQRGFQEDPRAAGRGLGLAAVRESVVRAGGTITVGSAAAGGALFTVQLPQLGARQNDAETAPQLA